MESVAVTKVANGINTAELLSLHQDHDEPFRTFATRVWSKAETCSLTIIRECKCVKRNVTSYTEEAVKDVMLASIGDTRREVLSTEDILSTSAFKITPFWKLLLPRSRDADRDQHAGGKTVFCLKLK